MRRANCRGGIDDGAREGLMNQAVVADSFHTELCDALSHFSQADAQQCKFGRRCF
jgi:hypothetical protein